MYLLLHAYFQGILAYFTPKRPSLMPNALCVEYVTDKFCTNVVCTPPGYSGDGGAATSATVSFPNGVAVGR